MARPLLVGETNPYGPDRRYDRVNLCTGKWSFSSARYHAAGLGIGGRWTVLLGARVAAAYRRAHDIPFELLTIDDRPDVRVVVLPHPSGLNRLWNDPGNWERSRELLRRADVL